MSSDPKGLFALITCVLIFGSQVSGWDDFRPNYRPESTVNIPSGYNDFPAIGTAFKFHRDRRSWSDAKRICRSEAGRLAIVDGTLKLDQLTSVVEYSSDIWIGIRKNGSQWLTVNSSPLGHIPWGYSYPNPVGDCAAFRTSTREVQNMQCDSELYFVCEIITGRTTGGAGSNHLYPDLRQIFNPSRGNSSYGNPTQRSPPFNGHSSDWNNPTQRNPHHGHHSWHNNPNNRNSSFNDPSFGNPTQRNPHAGHQSWHNNPSNGNPSYQNPTQSNPWYNNQPTRDPHYGQPSQGNPWYNNQPTRDPYYGQPSPGYPTPRNPAYGNPSYGTPSYDHSSQVTPSPFNPSHSNSSWGHHGR